MKKHGHYCIVCGEYRANEKFSGKGHAAHICKTCAKLPMEERSARIMVNKIHALPWFLRKEQKEWLKRKCHDHRPDVRTVAQEAYNIRFHPTPMESTGDYGDELCADETFDIF